MTDPFIGSELLRAGSLTPYALRSRYFAIYPDVHLPVGAELTAATRAKAAWQWTRREGIVAGQSAAALHGAQWVDARRPAEVQFGNRHAPEGVHVWSDRVPDDEVQVIDGVAVTTPARTALDIARRYQLERAVPAIDALARATHLKVADVELLAERYKGHRGIRRARGVLDLVDPGAESPQETRIRLMVIRNGFPRPQTQIPVHDEHGALVAVLDMGWEDKKIAIDYEGDHHRVNRARFNSDIRRHELVTGLRWTDIRVTAVDTEGGIMARLWTAWHRRV